MHRVIVEFNLHKSQPIKWQFYDFCFTTYSCVIVITVLAPSAIPVFWSLLLLSSTAESFWSSCDIELRGPREVMKSTMGSLIVSGTVDPRWPKLFVSRIDEYEVSAVLFQTSFHGRWSRIYIISWQAPPRVGSSKLCGCWIIQRNWIVLWFCYRELRKNETKWGLSTSFTPLSRRVV